MQNHLHLFDVFTVEVGKGNTIGIIYNPCEPLIPEHYMHLAFQHGLSEIAVIVAAMPEVGYDYEFRFFAPKEEVALCGHGTVGSIAFLYQHHHCRAKQTQLALKTGAGLIYGGQEEQKLYYMEQALPIFYSDPIDEVEVAAILGISPASFQNHRILLPLQMVSTGRNKLMVPIRDLKQLLAIRPDFSRMEAYCRKIGTNGFHLFTFETVLGPVGVHTRHFAPTAGVLEDPVTGNANGALGAYLVHYGVFDQGTRTHIYMEQGFSMGKDGVLYADIDRDAEGRITRVRISGSVVEKTS